MRQVVQFTTTLMPPLPPDPAVLSPVLTLASLVFSLSIIRTAVIIYFIVLVFASLIRISPGSMSQLLVKALNDTERLYHGAFQAGLFNRANDSDGCQQEIAEAEVTLQWLVFVLR